VKSCKKNAVAVNTNSKMEFHKQSSSGGDVVHAMCFDVVFSLFYALSLASRCIMAEEQNSRCVCSSNARFENSAATTSNCHHAHRRASKNIVNLYIHRYSMYSRMAALGYGMVNSLSLYSTTYSLPGTGKSSIYY